MIITFNETLPAVLHDAKTVTRRDWSERHAVAAWKARHLDLWSANPRNPQRNPRKIGVVELTRAPYPSNVYPGEDYRREGLKWLNEHGFMMRDPLHTSRRAMTPLEFWRSWAAARPTLYVVEFELVELDAACSRCGEGRTYHPYDRARAAFVGVGLGERHLYEVN